MSKKILHIIIAIGSFMLMQLVALVAGYFLSVLIFGFNGGFLQFLVAVCFGFILFVLAFLLLNVFKRKDDRSDYNARILSALEQISLGNFNVSVESNGRHPFAELAERINKMAKDLGTIETLRQDFVSNVSHEIQSPLTSIMGYVALLEKDDLSKDLRIEYLNVIKTESQRLSKLSKNLLKLSSLDAGLVSLNKANFRLDKQIQNVVILLEPQISAKNIAIKVNLNKVSVNADEELMQQVLINILHNAIKFTPDSGKIEITLSQKENKAVLKIADSGVGIAQEDLAHIFERFYKADKSRTRDNSGNGLGLALVKRIIILHNGLIETESLLDKGTVFTITI